jgi:ParB-like chromosome segregation protein Spo0J
MPRTSISKTKKKPDKKPAKAAAPPPAQIAAAIETWPIAKLKPNPKNARKHSSKQVEQLRKSFEQFGQVWPILVRADGTIIAGHGRLDAAKAAHLKSVRVIIANNWTQEQCRAYALLDNKVALNSEWDDDMLGSEISELKHSGIDIGILGFTPKELEALVPSGNAPEPAPLEAAYQILIECKSEAEQVELLTKFQKDGVACRALVV